MIYDIFINKVKTYLNQNKMNYQILLEDSNLFLVNIMGFDMSHVISIKMDNSDSSISFYGYDKEEKMSLDIDRFDEIFKLITNAQSYGVILETYDKFNNKLKSLEWHEKSLLNKQDIVEIYNKQLSKTNGKGNYNVSYIKYSDFLGKYIIKLIRDEKGNFLIQ